MTCTRSTPCGKSPCVSVRKIPSTCPSGTVRTLATKPATSRRLDRDHVTRGHVEGHLAGQRLAVEDVPARRAGLAAALPLGSVAPTLGDDRQAARFERAELPHDAVSAAMRPRASRAEAQSVALDSERIL